MTRYSCLAEVRGLPGVADPEGLTIERALPALGFAAVSEVSVGKAFRFVVEAGSAEEARQLGERLCAALLANPVIERAEVQVLGQDAHAVGGTEAGMPGRGPAAAAGEPAAGGAAAAGEPAAVVGAADSAEEAR